MSDGSRNLMTASSNLKDAVRAIFKVFSNSLQTRSQTAAHIEDEIIRIQQLMGRIRKDDTAFEPWYIKQGAPVTYIELFDAQLTGNLVSGSIFALQEHGELPLHNHPTMYGFIKCIYGRIKIDSYTVTTTNESSNFTLLNTETLPSKILTENDNEVAVVRPNVGNIHSIKPIGGPAAFIDFITPPYSSHFGKLSCSYYKTVINSDSEPHSVILQKMPCPDWYFCETNKYCGPDLSELFLP